MSVIDGMNAVQEFDCYSVAPEQCYHAHPEFGPLQIFGRSEERAEERF